MSMDIKQELFMISPSPISIGDREVFSLSVSQVLGYMARVEDSSELLPFLMREHGTATGELIQLYEASLAFLKVPEKEVKKVDQPKEGYNAKASQGLIMTSSIHMVGKQFNMSFSEVLAMPVTQYHLCLKHCGYVQEVEKKAFEKSKRSKK